MRDGKLAEALETVQRLSDNPFYERKFLGACLQGSSGSDFDRLSEEVEGTLLTVPDPEPLYYSGADLVLKVSNIEQLSGCGTSHHVAVKTKELTGKQMLSVPCTILWRSDQGTLQTEYRYPAHRTAPRS